MDLFYICFQRYIKYFNYILIMSINISIVHIVFIYSTYILFHTLYSCINKQAITNEQGFVLIGLSVIYNAEDILIYSTVQ